MPVIEVPSSVVFVKARSDACLFRSVRTCSNMHHTLSEFFTHAHSCVDVLRWLEWLIFDTWPHRLKDKE